jgi:3-(3-hydroxy-phenyl)propionate hydroxylase
MPDDPDLPAATRLATAVTGGRYELPVYPFVEPAELRGELGRHAVVIIGAGLAGLTLACDLGQRGIPAVVLDEDDTVGVRGAASRGICYAQRSLEIFRRLGIYERMLQKGLQWSVGRTLAGDDEIYQFDLRTQRSHDASCQPPFINLQQFYVEWFLVDRIYEQGVVDLRWKNRVIALEQHADHVALQVDTPAGTYRCEALWVIDCSGSHSPVRAWAGVAADASRVEDRWCISDVRFAHTPPAERWTWIKAPFNDDRAVWQHLMADDVWRLDYQMAADADPDAISRPEVVADRLRRQFGADVRYELVWVGPYAYRSLCLRAFRAGRVLFGGDAAHVMSPFGARGGNSGVQDADNLGWKLALVLNGQAPQHLLDSYDAERRAAAQENIRITRRTSRFLSPATPAERLFRDAVIDLARTHPFARTLVNTGRLSSATHYRATPLAAGPGAGEPVQNMSLSLLPAQRGQGGRSAVRAGDLLDLFGEDAAHLVALALAPLADDPGLRELEQRYPLRVVVVVGATAAGTPTAAPSAVASAWPQVADTSGRLTERLGLNAQGMVLLRPDLHQAGRLSGRSPAALEHAVRVALALEPASPLQENP